MKLPRNSQSRSKSRQKCLRVQNQVLVSVGVDRANLRRVRLLLHLPGVSSGPTRSTQSTDVAAARPRTASANVQSAATAAARNTQEAWRGAAAAPLTRSPAITAADERHREQVSPRRQTDRIRASRSPLSHPEKKLEGREAPFKLLFLRQRESAAPHHRSPPQTSPTLLLFSPALPHQATHQMHAADWLPRARGEQRGQGVANARTLRWPWDRTPICCPCRLGCTEHTLVETTDTTLWPTKVLEWLVCRREARSKIKTQWPRLHLPAEICSWKRSHSSTVAFECKALCLVNLSTKQMVDNIM